MRTVSEQLLPSVGDILLSGLHAQAVHWIELSILVLGLVYLLLITRKFPDLQQEIGRTVYTSSSMTCNYGPKSLSVEFSSYMCLECHKEPYNTTLGLTNEVCSSQHQHGNRHTERLSLPLHHMLRINSLADVCIYSSVRLLSILMVIVALYRCQIIFMV